MSNIDLEAFIDTIPVDGEVCTDAYAEFNDEMPLTEGAGARGYREFSKKLKTEGKEYKNKVKEATRMVKSGEGKRAVPILKDCITYYTKMRAEAKKIPDDDWNDVLLTSLIAAFFAPSTVAASTTVTAHQNKSHYRSTAIKMIDMQIARCEMMIRQIND